MNCHILWCASRKDCRAKARCSYALQFVKCVIARPDPGRYRPVARPRPVPAGNTKPRNADEARLVREAGTPEDLIGPSRDRD